MQIPSDEKILAAVGKIAIRHGQLDHILKMTVKSILGISIEKALDATQRQASSELRKRVRTLAKQKLGEGNTLVRLDALLTRAKRATESRNEILHSLWAVELDGNTVIRDENHKFQEVPEIDELEKVANGLAKITADLNEARLDGFLKDALTKCLG